MEQFRQIGEVVGSINALMVFQDNLFNQRQCYLLVDMLTTGYKTIAEQIKHNLKFEEKNTKWKIIEHPLKELLRVFKEGEAYIKMCLETKDWWAKAILLYQNSDCVEFHIHNLLTIVPVVIEAIDMAGMISGCDFEIQKKKVVYSLKYQKELKDCSVFQFVFGDQYLVCQDFCSRIDAVWEEDRWFLLKEIRDRKKSGCLSKRDTRLADVVMKYLSSSENGDDHDVWLPCSTLLNSKDYQVRRRLGNGKEVKEIQWLGESFALRHFRGEIEPGVSTEVSLSHPNIQHILCAFTDEERKEFFLVMELMNKDLSSYIKEICGPKKRVPFSIPVAVDLMLQVARGMEYLHSKKIYHGELNPSNILIKGRGVSTDGYLHAKILGFGLAASITTPTPTAQSPCIWHAPEVLAEQESMTEGGSKFSEKADVYSFGMICFEVLTGKVPFEDAHLQGDKMARNIRSGERPLFPFHSPKFITNLMKKCWHNDPAQRPSFASICRVLRYTKRFLVMNPEYSQPDAPVPPMDFSDLEVGLVSNSGSNMKVSTVSQIPFQMFFYRVVERERANASQRDTSESGSDGASTCGEENALMVEEMLMSPVNKRSPTSASPKPEANVKKLSLSRRSFEITTTKQPGTPKGRSVRPPHTPTGRSMRMNSERNLMAMSPRTRRRSGHASDSELS